MHLGSFFFSLAPDTGKNPGAIYVKRDGKDGDYLGKAMGGQFMPVCECSPADAKAIIAIAADPAASATAYGQRTGRCSICSRTLTNKESIGRAVGPICYEKFFG